METEAHVGSAKTRNQRIPLGYLNRGECADRSGKRRKWFVLAFGALAAAAAIFLAVRPDGLRLASHGPVIEAHAHFENDCAICHRPESTTLGFLGAKADPPPHFHESDIACAQCHHAPAHFDHLHLDGKEASCFSCHRDHSGRTVDLKRTPDANCTACHADPMGWEASTRIVGREFAKAGAFAAGQHPEFALTKASGQKLHFNHAVHLSPGMKVGFAFGKLPYKHRLRKNNEASAAVELDCSACHERVAGSKSGDDFAAVKYERHCADCHSLKVPSYAAKAASRDEVPSISLPHGVDGNALRDLVIGAYSKQALEGNPTLRQSLVRNPMTATAFAGRPDLKAENDKLEFRADETLRHLASSPQACGECHLFHPPVAAEKFSSRVMKPEIPDRWWTRAKFSHAAHSSDCSSCHKTSTDVVAEKSEKSTDVLMPTFQSCLACHDSGKSGVRADCVLCHGYHGVGLPENADRHHRLTPRGGQVRR